MRVLKTRGVREESSGKIVMTLRDYPCKPRIVGAIGAQMLTLLLSMVAGLASQTLPRKATPPRFEDYPVRERFTGRPAPVDLSSDPRARRYRTVLREGARKGPNFAGH